MISNRERVMADLQRASVPTAAYYPVPLHKQPAFENYPRLEDLSRSEWLYNPSLLSLPKHPYLSENMLRQFSAAGGVS